MLGLSIVLAQIRLANTSLANRGLSWREKYLSSLSPPTGLTNHSKSAPKFTSQNRLEFIVGPEYVSKARSHSKVGPQVFIPNSDRKCKVGPICFPQILPLAARLGNMFGTHFKVTFKFGKHWERF